MPHYELCPLALPDAFEDVDDELSAEQTWKVLKNLRMVTVTYRYILLCRNTRK